MGFEAPPGDPDALDAALRSLGSVGADVHTASTGVTGGFAAALGSWRGTRADDFRNASAGMQLQVQEAASSVDTAVADLTAYARILRANTKEIQDLKSQADRRTSQADAFARSHATNDTAVDMEYQHAGMFVGSLEQQAAGLRADVQRAARATAGLIDAATDIAVPRSSSLTPAEIARRVDSSTGISGIAQATGAGTLTADEAWGALSAATNEVPEDAINSDGSINADKLAEDVNEAEKEEAENPTKKGLDTTLDYWTLASGAPGGWSVLRLAHATVAFSRAKSALPVDLYKLTQTQLDKIPKGPAENPLSVLDEIERGPKFTPADTNAFSSLSKLESAQEAIGGLGKFETVGRVFDGLAVFGDVWTLSDPDAATDDKVDAGVNLVGIGLTTEAGASAVEGGLALGGIAATDAALGWIPVVGWGLVAITAGYEVWKHWSAIKEYTGEAAHAVGNFVTSTAPHALSSAAHGVSHFVTSHIPHVHLW